MRFFVLFFLLSLSAQAADGARCGPAFERLAPGAHTYLTKAYAHFLSEMRNQAPKYMPATIEWKGETLQVVDYLGSGIEANVYRVRDAHGKESLMKVYFAYTEPLRGKVKDYLKLEREGLFTQKVLGADFERKMIRFENNRGIPLDVLKKVLQSAPESVREKLTAAIQAGQAAEHPGFNQVFDIDAMQVRVIDPY